MTQLLTKPIQKFSNIPDGHEILSGRRWKIERNEIIGREVEARQKAPSSASHYTFR